MSSPNFVIPAPERGEAFVDYARRVRDNPIYTLTYGCKPGLRLLFDTHRLFESIREEN